MSDVTQILSAIEQGDPSASEQLLPLVYEELHEVIYKIRQIVGGQDLAAQSDWRVVMVEEIDKKIKLYVDLGEFEKADLFSKKQLAMVENDNLELI